MKTFIECQSCQSSNGPRLIDIGNDNNSRVNRTNNINDDQDVSLIRIIDHQHQFSDEWSANNYENSSNININNNNNSNTSSTKISDIFAEILHHPIPLSSIFTFNNIINIIINPSNLSKKKLNHHYNTLLIILWILISLLLLMAKHIQCYDDNFNDDLDQTFTSICESNGGINAIGMESGMIPDSALSASSSYNEQSVGPQNARLNRELYGGAWCPSTQINQTNSGHEWIQINLTETYVITKIATQGRFGNGMGVEYAEIFWLNYTRDGVRWTRWSNMNGEFDIQGNMDTYSIVENVLTIPLVAITAIRLLPVSSYTRTCCLRLEIYGCPYKDGPISYSMIDGQLNGRFGDLIDHTYDGYRSETGFLSDGLGQLTDGIRGDDNYKVNKGFEWIGWKANTQSVVSITFRFADIRNFTSATFHCHNMFTKDIQVFHSAQIWFSLDGRQWSSMPEDFAYMPDMVFEKARDVIIHLHHRIGRFIKFDFRFAAKWLLISEATFDSNAVNGGLSINELDFVDSRPITKSLLNANNNIQTSSSINTQINRHNSNNNNDSYNSLYREPFFLIGFTIMIVLLITIFIIMLIWFTQKRKEKITGSEYTTVPMKDVSPSAIYCEPNGFANHHHHLTFPNVSVTADPEYAVPDLLGGGGVGGGGSNGPSSTFMTTNKANNNLLFINNYRQQQQPLISSFANKTMMMANNPDDGKARYYAATDVLVRNGGNNYPTSNIIAINRNGNSPLSLAPLPASQVYPTKHDSTPSSSLSSSNTSKVLKNNNSSTPSTALEIYENTPITSNGSSLSNSMAPLLKDKEISIIDGHFGYSKYGDCELGYLNRSKNDKQLVFLKTLSSNQNTKLQKEFVAEMNEKWRLSNQCPKIFAKLFGYISKYDYLAMVIECGDMDLKRFLSNSSSQIIRMEQLLEISRQIAKAMQELHENSFIHRDLAARNCLIYPKNFQIKISDIGSSNNEYKNEYYQQCFPIRWMSYEAIIESKFTTKSDVYSFGVTLWEIMNYCQSLPHHFLSDEELLTHVYNYENLDKVYDTSSSTSSTAFYNHPFTNNDNINELTKYNLLQLPKPKDCSNDIYDLIIECTQYMADSRPEFEEIVNFIQTKNLAL